MAAPLLIIGGAEDRGADDEILRCFVALAGGADARVVVLPSASQIPDEVAAEYQSAFSQLGVADVAVLNPQSREQANEAAFLQPLQKATGAFLTGGDQTRLATLLGGTQLDTLLHERHDDGLVLAGTSAGAAVMSSTMITAGDDVVATEGVQTAPGLEFLQGVLIDMHFAERGRLQRLLSAVALFPHQLGVGIDENTALLVRGHQFDVLGTGAVTVVDAGSVAQLRVREDSQRTALTDVRLHILPAGSSFDLAHRRPVLHADSLEEGRKEAARET